MKTKTYYKPSKLVEASFAVMSIILNLIWFIPVFYVVTHAEDNTITIVAFILITVLFWFCWVKITMYFINKHKSHVEERIEKEREQHIKDFFDFLKQDEQFIHNNLRFNVPIYNLNREKIGSSDAYINLLEKREKYLKQ
jgi:c-di-AMP phosphodiesterase-like protein